MRIDTSTQRVLENLKIQGAEIVIVERLDRTSYKKVNDVLEALGGKWNTRRKAHVFGTDAAGDETELRELVEAVITSGEIETLRDSRKKLGWFPTPAPLAAELVRDIVVPEGTYVLEPSAGDGAIVAALLARGFKVIAVEIDKDRAKALAKRLPQGAPYILFNEDFLTWTPPSSLVVGAVAMNPPFIQHLEHVRRAFELMMPGGDLTSVLPNSVMYRKDKKHEAFTAWIAKETAHEAWKTLPDNSFRSSGTDVNTVVLNVRKKEGVA